MVAIEDETVVFFDVTARAGADKGMLEENPPAAR